MLPYQKTTSLLLGGLLAAPASWSAVNTGNTLDIPASDSVVVTATRVEQSAADVLAPVSVIDRADIERLQSKDVVEALQHLPGVDIIRSGGKGSVASLYLRGTNDDHTLFLIDGQRVSSATLGTTSFELIDLEQIDRIEVVRGPRSALYGSDAIGGVVQIFTRRPGTDPEGYIRLGYGNHDSSQIAAGGSGSIDKLHVAANISHYYTGGISDLKDKTPDNDDRDNYRNTSLSLRASYDFSDTTILDLAHLYTAAANQYDSAYDPDHQPYSENWLQNTSATLNAQLLSFWHSRWSIGRSIDDNDNFAKFDPASHFDFRTTRDSASWQNDFSIAERQTLSAGIDYYKERIDSSSDFTTADGEPVHSRDHKGYFGQYLLTSNLIDLQLGVRRDDIEDFSQQTTGNIAVGFNLPANQKLIASYGTAFKAPTFNDLYWPIDPYSFGNPNLKAETSKNIELEWRGQYTAWNWSASIFQNKIRNLIDWAPVDISNPYTYTPSNVANARIRGIELSAGGTLFDWRLNGSVSYIDPRDTDTDNVLTNRSRRRITLDADRPFGPWSVGMSWRAQDFHYGDAGNTQRVGGYGLVDVRAGYEFSKTWQAQLKLNNIFDRSYTERPDYNVERFGVFATITYRL